MSLVSFFAFAASCNFFWADESSYRWEPHTMQPKILACWAWTRKEAPTWKSVLVCLPEDLVLCLCLFLVLCILFLFLLKGYLLLLCQLLLSPFLHFLWFVFLSLSLFLCLVLFLVLSLALPALVFFVILRSVLRLRVVILGCLPCRCMRAGKCFQYSISQHNRKSAEVDVMAISIQKDMRMNRYSKLLLSSPMHELGSYINDVPANCTSTVSDIFSKSKA